MLERIDKIFSSYAISTRKECAAFIKKGLVCVDNVKVKNPSEKADVTINEITLNGEKLTFKKYVYIMLNKPLGVISATEDSCQQTVLDIIPKDMYREGLFPCGRLDKDTLGLVILTNDGKSAHKRLAPKTHAEKEYYFKTIEPVSNKDVEKIEKGVTLKDGYTTAPCKVVMNGDCSGIITLTEGKYHEIKRIFGSLNNKIIYLERISFAGIKLDSILKRGECRYLTLEEEKLFTT